MPLDKEQLKASLLKRYAEQLDQMLDKLDKPERLHLSEIEDAALDIRKRVSQDVTESLSQHESQLGEVDVCCPECQQVLRYKGKKRKWIKTRTGDIQVEREYWYCAKCRTGFFPTG